MKKSEQALPPDSYDDEIDLRELLRVLWTGKWLIGSITLAASVIAIVVALMLPNIYSAEALLAPNDHEGKGALSTLANQYGGLASLAGINIDRSSSDKTTLGLEILGSRKFISEFIERHDILVPLMAAKGWDASTGMLKIDTKEYDVVKERWVRDVRPPKMAAPSTQEAYKEFSDNLTVSQDKMTGLVTVAFEHVSPTIAKEWVDWLIDDLNLSIMRQDVSEAKQAIDYLNEQIAATSVADLRSVFFRLIEEQTKTVMLANVSTQYLFRIIDPAVAPELKHKPNRALIGLLGMVFGWVVGVIVVLIGRGVAPQRE